LKLSQVEVQKFSGDVQNDFRGGAHLPSKSGLDANTFVDELQGVQKTAQFENVR
jgi:hypothetical protein